MVALEDKYITPDYKVDTKNGMVNMYGSWMKDWNWYKGGYGEIDGGIRENVAWKELKFLGADKVLNITFDDDIDEDCSKNIIEVASTSIGLLCRELRNYEMEDFV